MDEDIVTKQIHAYWNEYFSEDDNFTLWTQIIKDGIQIQLEALWEKYGQASGNYSCMYEDFIYKLADPELFEKIDDQIKKWAEDRCEILDEVMV